jgi:phosphocarrier protein HPr
MTTSSVVIRNPLGLHARAAARFVHAASAFQSRVLVTKGSMEIDGKSIMGLLLLTAAQGTTVTICADGVDEQDAIATLSALVERGFDEAPWS